ncbi:hypothetical protein ACVITL_005009 [Rhizobium pisi]
MAYLGLVPSESSTGEKVKRGGITKAGNTRARRVLIEGAWTYRCRIRPMPGTRTGEVHIERPAFAVGDIANDPVFADPAAGGEIVTANGLVIARETVRQFGSG